MSFRFQNMVATVIAALAGPIAAADTPKQILMIAGAPSHGYGAHEHYAGLRLLADEVDGDDAVATVTRGWPEDDSMIQRADAIVFFADGGERHPALPHYNRLAEKIADGCGLAAIHYAVETVNDQRGQQWLAWLGGHFETHYSVNPHWEAAVEPNADHPITRGLKSFRLNDEWYFHLRFAQRGVTPILTAVAPESTMSRRDGHHSGNPTVRQSVARGDVQTLAWAYQRPHDEASGGGRSFGITGGHYHWVWGDPTMRCVVARGIRWSANLPALVPSDAPEISKKVLLKHQDYDQPAAFDDAVIGTYLTNQ